MRLAFIALAAGLALPVQAQIIGTATPIPPSTGVNNSQGIPIGATIPRVVSTVPANGQNNVGTSTRFIQITFDQPMDVATFYWPVTVQADFPNVTGQPVWSNGNRTVSLPVSLGANTLYRIPLNVNTRVFRSANGVYLEQGMISFSTGAGGGGSAITRPRSGGFNTTPRNNNIGNQTIPSGGLNPSTNRSSSGVSRVPSSGNPSNSSGGISPGRTSVAQTPVGGGALPQGASQNGRKKTNLSGSN